MRVSAFRARRIRAGIIISLMTFIFMCVLGEVYFRYIHLQSDSFNFTLMSRRWFSVCWQPQNMNGSITYRDRKWTAADVQGKIRVMLVGDSFVAGHGLCNPEDRASAVLQKLLGDRYVVFTVADNGWDTRQELAAMQDYPFKPDVVILSYVLNDMLKAAQDVYGPASVQFEIPPSGNLLIDQSYLMDYIYWQIAFKRLFIETLQRGERNTLQTYFDPRVWPIHTADLQKVIDWTKAQDARLIVFTWPFLTKVSDSAPEMRRVETVFQERGIEVLSGLDLFAPEDANRWIVSAIDPHPNAAADRKVAEALFKRLMTDPERPAP